MSQTPAPTRSFECSRFPDEVCSQCGSFGPFGRGPPMQHAFERRCVDHLWPDFWSRLQGPPQPAERPQPRADDEPAPERRAAQGRLL